MTIFVGDDWGPSRRSPDGRRRAKLASRRLPERLAGIRGLHQLVAARAEEPAQVVIGIKTDRGLLPLEGRKTPHTARMAG